MKQKSIRGTFKSGQHKGNKRVFVIPGEQFIFSNGSGSIGIMCSFGGFWRCHKTKEDCGHDCHLKGKE